MRAFLFEFFLGESERKILVGEEGVCGDGYGEYWMLG